MKVFILIRFDLEDDVSVHGVFSSLEKAEKGKAFIDQHYIASCNIQEFELDQPDMSHRTPDYKPGLLTQ